MFSLGYKLGVGFRCAFVLYVCTCIYVTLFSVGSLRVFRFYGILCFCLGDRLGKGFSLFFRGDGVFFRFCFVGIGFVC